MKYVSRFIPVIIFVFLASLPFLFAESTTRFWQGVMIQIFVLAIYALSYDILLGFTGIVSFGQALFLGVGGYTTAMLLERNVAVPVVVLVVIGVGILVGAGIGLLTLRLSGVYFSMMTLALAEITFIIFHSDDRTLKPYTGGEIGLQGLEVPTLIDSTANRLNFYFLALLAATGAYYLARRIMNSPTGRVFVAVRENEPRAQALGYNTLTYKVLATILSSTLAAFAGMLLVFYEKSATFEMFSVSLTIQALLMTIIGGIGTLFGPMLGAATIRLLDQWLRSAAVSDALPPWLRPDLLFGLVYVALVLFFPAGIMGAINRLRGRTSRRNKAHLTQALQPREAVEDGR